MQRVYSLLVDNNSGVLSRISGLFTRRGYNIDSITAGVTADSRFTRIRLYPVEMRLFYLRLKSRLPSWKT